MNNRCPCWEPLSIRQAATAVIDEMKEFCDNPTLDELDDVKVCMNRLIGSFFKKPMVKLFNTPLYDRKVKVRMHDHDCIRSKRHLVNGCCPSRIMK